MDAGSVTDHPRRDSTSFFLLTAASKHTQLYTLAGTTNLRLDAAAPCAPAPSTLRCCAVVAAEGGDGGPSPATTILAGGADGRLRAWALDGSGGLVETQAGASTSAPAHAGGVQALATAGGSAPFTSAFASAGSDGSVAVWDGRASLAGRPVTRLGGDDDGASTSSSDPGATVAAGPAWAVALAAGPDPLALAGHAAGLVRLWCLRTGRARWAGRLPGGAGVCGVGFGPAAADTGGPATYFTAATGGLVTALEAGTHHPDSGLAATAARLGASAGAGPPPTVWTATPLPGSRGLVGCACGDGRLRLLRHRRAAGSARAPAPDGRPAGVPGALAPLASARLADQALTCLAWCGGHAGLFAAGGMDEALRVGVVPKAGIV
jgi:hypothetical protein